MKTEDEKYDALQTLAYWIVAAALVFLGVGVVCCTVRLVVGCLSGN